MKTVVEERRKQRETVDKIKSRVTEMRKVALAVQFAEWTLDTRGQLPLALVTSAAAGAPPHTSLIGLKKVAERWDSFKQSQSSF